jgi:hypothetical protein
MASHASSDLHEEEKRLLEQLQQGNQNQAPQI